MLNVEWRVWESLSEIRIKGSKGLCLRPRLTSVKGMEHDYMVELK